MLRDFLNGARQIRRMIIESKSGRFLVCLLLVTLVAAGCWSAAEDEYLTEVRPLLEKYQDVALRALEMDEVVNDAHLKALEYLNSLAEDIELSDVAHATEMFREDLGDIRERSIQLARLGNEAISLQKRWLEVDAPSECLTHWSDHLGLLGSLQRYTFALQRHFEDVRQAFSQGNALIVLELRSEGDDLDVALEEHGKYVTGDSRIHSATC